MSTDLGLTLDAYSWPLYLGMAALWAWSVRSVPDWRRLGWQSIPMSLFGWVWLGFAVDIIIRFPLLSWDSYTFGNMTSRLADAGSDEVNEALLLATLFFACVVGAYRVGRGFIAKLLKIRMALPAEDSQQGQMLLALLSTVGIVLSSGLITMPKALVTPFGILGFFWVLPAVFAWWDRFHGGGRHISPLCWILLLPGFLHILLSPYRENFLRVLLVVFLAALFSGKRFRLVTVSVALIAAFLLSTAVIGAYRQVLWEDDTAREALEYTQSGYTLEKTYDAKWVVALRRFHGFDSLLLTVRYVPESLPHSERAVVIDSIVRGFVPRAIYEDKEGSTRGVDFGQSVWSYESESSASGAAIAPSMPGDLYEAEGIMMVALGGILWGLILGLLEGWKAHLSPKAAGALIALFALGCAASVERDFAHVVSTMIQYLIVMFILAKLFGGSTSRIKSAHLPRRHA